MSADSPSHRHGTNNNNNSNSRMSTNASGNQTSNFVVRPQPITEASLMDSVAGFITEVQAFHQQATQSQSGDGGRVHVTWAKFEKTDINDNVFYSEMMEINGNYPPLLLVLGYTQGVQVWLIPASGEAQELLSWKYGQVKALKILPTPENVYGSPDNFAHCRPLAVMVDSTGPGTPFSSASFISLRTGEVVQNIKFNSEIADVSANRRVVVMAFKEKLAAFDACNLEARFTVSSCYPSPGVHVNPIALGNRWLAYADQRLVNIHRSMGGMEVDGNQSVTAWGINVGSKLAQGVSKIYNNIFSTGPSRSSSSAIGSSAGSVGSSGMSQNEPQKGVVTIIDLLRIYRQDREEVMMLDKIDGIVAHFIAHNKAIVAMEFDANGTLLLTCDRLGNYFNLFRIIAHPAGSCYTAVHHLYSLYRGDTPGAVQDIAFSPDSRWVAVSTLRGTTHIFPITPYGGPVGVRTHTSSRVVNRLSRFHRSAGLDEHPPAGRTSSSGRSSPNPILGSSPVFSKMSLDPISSLPLIIPYPNPHVPPFPSPTLVQPVAQLRQPYLVTLTNQTLGSAASGVGARKPKHSGSASAAPNPEDIPIRLAVTFAPSRAWLVGGSQNSVFHRQPRRMHDSLFVVANHGVLLEYLLDPVPDPTLPKEKICELSPIELHVTAFGQWTMPTPSRERPDLQPPVAPDNPLLSPLEHLTAKTTTSATVRKEFGAASTPSMSSPSSLSGIQDPSLNDELWLSQVEIVTHIGPHRRLWMGPQFCFKTFRRSDGGRGGNEVLDINLNARPEQSNPVNMPSALKHHDGVPVLIEASSASSFELSPHFANQMSHRGSREQMSTDVESELKEAMSDVFDDPLLDGGTGTGHQHGHYHQQHAHHISASGKITRKSSWRYPGGGPYPGAGGPRPDSGCYPAEEEFFCLTPEDARSIASSGGRSRNASSTSISSSTKTSSNFPVQMGHMADTKIFSVAVEARSTEQPAVDAMIISDVDTDFTGRFAVVSSSASSTAASTYSSTTTTTSSLEKKMTVAAVRAATTTTTTASSTTTTTAAVTKSGSRSKGKKGRKNRSSEDEESSSSTATTTTTTTTTSSSNKSKKASVDNVDKGNIGNKNKRFDNLTLNKTDDFCRDVTPKMDDEEVFELTSNQGLIDESHDSTVDLLADALQCVVVDNETHEKSSVTSTQPRLISPTPSEDFQEMTSPGKPLHPEPNSDDEEEEKFFIREKKSSDSEADEEESDYRKSKTGSAKKKTTSCKSPVSLLDDLIGPETGNSIVKSIEFAAKLYGGNTDDDDEDVVVDNVEDVSGSGKKSIRARKKLEGNLIDSSEDDLEFKEVNNHQRRTKRTKKRNGESSSDDNNDENGTSAGSYADSESSMGGGGDCGSTGRPGNSEGWSFEADDLDITKLIAEVVHQQQQQQQQLQQQASATSATVEEKTSLEDIFKFDSELVAARDEDEDDDDDQSKDGVGATTDDSENDCHVTTTKKKIMSTSLNVTFDESIQSSDHDASSLLRGGTASLTQSLVCGGGGSTSADNSSVGNSPNPKKNKNKSKKKKRR